MPHVLSTPPPPTCLLVCAMYCIHMTVARQIVSSWKLISYSLDFYYNVSNDLLGFTNLTSVTIFMLLRRGGGGGAGGGYRGCMQVWDKGASLVDDLDNQH